MLRRAPRAVGRLSDDDARHADPRCARTCHGEDAGSDCCSAREGFRCGVSQASFIFSFSSKVNAGCFNSQTNTVSFNCNSLSTHR